MCSQERSSFSTRVRDCANELARSGISALGVLYDLTSPRLVRYALTLTRNQYDAEDAVQATLVRVAMRPHLLAGATYPWPYILRILRNEALAMARRERREMVVNELPEPVRNVRDTCSEQERKREVWKAMGKLPPHQAEVVVLKIWEEMTFAEIARVLDKSPNTVASRYQYALQKLAKHLRSLHGEVIHD